jgi:Chitin synthase N-terminal
MDTSQILDEISRLRLQLPPEVQESGNYMLERYLDNLTTYAETVISDESLSSGGQEAVSLVAPLQNTTDGRAVEAESEEQPSNIAPQIWDIEEKLESLPSSSVQSPSDSKAIELEAHSEAKSLRGSPKASHFLEPRRNNLTKTTSTGDLTVPSRGLDREIRTSKSLTSENNANIQSKLSLPKSYIIDHGDNGGSSKDLIAAPSRKQRVEHTSKTEPFTVRRIPMVSGWLTQTISLIHKQLVFDCPVPVELWEKIDNSTFKQMAHLNRWDKQLYAETTNEWYYQRYSAVTCAADSFHHLGYTLRPKSLAVPRETELLITLDATEPHFLAKRHSRNLASQLASVQHAVASLDQRFVDGSSQSPHLRWTNIVACIFIERQSSSEIRSWLVELGLCQKVEGTILYADTKGTKKYAYDDGRIFPLEVLGKPVLARVYGVCS